MLSNATWIVDSRAEDLTRYVSRGVELMTRVLERATNGSSELSARLRALSPQSTLDRGYAIVQQGALVGGDFAVGGGSGAGHIVRSPADAPLDAALTITLASGALKARSEGELSDLHNR